MLYFQGKTKKVGRPPQNQPRPVAPIQNQTLLQPVAQQQLQQQQQSQVYQQATLLRNSNQLRLEPMYVYVSI